MPTSTTGAEVSGIIALSATDMSVQADLGHSSSPVCLLAASPVLANEDSNDSKVPIEIFSRT